MVRLRGGIRETRGNGTVTSYDFDAVSRLDELAQNLSGTANDLTLGFTHNPAGQIAGNTRSNDGYSFTGLANGSVTDTLNGLNQVTATGATSVTHDARGNISAIGSSSYGYSSENLLTSGPSSVTLSYDPMLRLYQTSGGATTRFAYDGLALIAEHDGSNNLLRRYVHGPGMDEPLVQYEGAGTSDRRFLHADERGSIIALTDSAGALSGSINLYDEYGRPQGTMNGRFGYTGQTWLPELNLWYYKARMYNPSAPGGRFMQTDPIGYGAGMNLYAYVSGDPVNFIDPTGTECKVIELNNWDIFNGHTGEYLGSEIGEVHTRRYVCSISGGGGGSKDGGGGGGGGESGLPRCLGPSNARDMSEATNRALRSVRVGFLSFPNTVPLSPEFSRVEQLPNFSQGGWTSVFSSHATAAWEHALPGSDYAIKIYIGDSNFGGANTAAIVHPTSSAQHYVNFVPFMMGAPVNSQSAAEYMGYPCF